jgi:hypothetical protein
VIQHDKAHLDFGVETLNQYSSFDLHKYIKHDKLFAPSIRSPKRTETIGFPLKNKQGICLICVHASLENFISSVKEKSWKFLHSIFYKESEALSITVLLFMLHSK